MCYSPLYQKLLAGAVLSVIVLLLYPFLPERHLKVLPSAEVEQYLLADKAKGGTSQASWVSREQHHLKCDIKTGKITPFCGMQIKLANNFGKGMNLAVYNRFKLKIYYNGSSAMLRFHLRSFDPRFSKVGDTQSEKFQSYSLYASETNHVLEIPFSAITVADWWLKEFAVKRDYASVDLTNVTYLGVDIPGPIAAGEHEIRMDHLEFIGPWVSREHWYLGILILWLPLLLWLINRQQKVLAKRLGVDTLRLAEFANSYGEVSIAVTPGQHRDHVTGLLDRVGLAATLRAHKHDRLVLALLDIDKFGPLNNSLGHELGNELLGQFADFIAAVTPSTLAVCRWGDDKFVVVLSGNDVAMARLLLHRLRLTIANHHFDLRGELLTLTAAIAWQTLEPDSSPRAALNSLIHTLAKVKMRGGNDLVEK